MSVSEIGCVVANENVEANLFFFYSTPRRFNLLILAFDFFFLYCSAMTKVFRFGFYFEF